ncbi:MAG TPA: SPOR domain-containing protein [Pseudomonas sp.]|nr:SPOR domain-containing protein [Pseudomonas sp.]
MVGALVLVALAVIFLPMLLSREDEARRVQVEAPAMPQAPVMPLIEVEPVIVPEPQLLPDEPIPGDAPAVPATPEPPVAAQPPSAVPKPPTAQVAVPETPSRLDANNLPISWSVQLASLSSRESAEKLQKSLRSQGYNAYIRTADSMNRVFVGPLIERAEADRLRDLLSRQQKLKGFVVRFQPERG